ncbi:unnamed protein product, partial [Staurois parvus]
MDTGSAHVQSVELQSVDFEWRKLLLQVSLDFDISGWGSVVWRFKSALEGKKSPIQCPEFAVNQQGLGPGAHSPYNYDLLRVAGGSRVQWLPLSGSV